jgi:hypothetical protein
MEQASRSMNSLLPLGAQNTMKTLRTNATNAMNSVAASAGQVSSSVASILPSFNASYIGIGFFLALVIVCVVLFKVYWQQITDGWNASISATRKALGYDVEPPPKELPTPVTEHPPSNTDTVTPPVNDIVDKVLPASSPQVYSVSQNKFTYYDAEPLCRALGAELATYDQVKQAWQRGADWCNYGWVKGQMAVYPTQKDTWSKLQAGPEEQRMACGNPGLNGGFYDNPELRFGVNCYGPKPAQSSNDASLISRGAPQSPGALEFDKKVAKFRSEADSVGVLPFSGDKWSN